MSKKDEHIQDDELQAKLEEAKKSQHDKKYLELQAKILQLEKEKKEVEEIAKRVQYDYVTLKFDFERFQDQMKKNEKENELESLLKIVKKFLPFIEDLRKSLENITQEHQDDPLTKGVKMIYEKFIKTLEHMHIHAIDALWLTPDSFLHEPVNVQPVQDEKLKWKIIQEFEKGFLYEHDGQKKVLLPAKVIVGQ